MCYVCPLETVFSLELPEMVFRNLCYINAIVFLCKVFSQVTELKRYIMLLSILIHSPSLIFFKHML